MQQTTVLALIFVMFAQFLTLTFGVLILWWMGDFRDTARNDRYPTDRVEETTIAIRDVGSPSNDNGQLVSLQHDDHSIQPRVTEDQAGEEKHVERLRAGL
jgi:hypothetical protein